jgi:hypothetical protein
VSLITERLVFIRGPVFVDGKLSFSGGLMVVHEDQGRSDMVQGATGLMDGFASENADSWWNADLREHTLKIFERVRIVVGDASVGCGVEKGFHLDVELIDVLSGPL